MRETKNLKLTQFEPNDIPNWLDQYNTDMEKIDTANGSQNVVNEGYETRFTNDEEKINNNRTQINENTQDIANIKDDIKNIKGGSNVDLNTLQTEITTVEQSVTNLKGGSTRTIAELENDLNTDQQNISALDGRVETLEDSVTGLETKTGKEDISNVAKNITSAIGNKALMTNDKTLSGAINELTLQKSHQPFFIAATRAEFTSLTNNTQTVKLTLANTLREVGANKTMGVTLVPEVVRGNNDSNPEYTIMVSSEPLYITDSNIDSNVITIKTRTISEVTSSILTESNFTVKVQRGTI